jgi:Uma2 family endonuclease
MTAMPAPRHDPAVPDHPLTVTEYAALGETEHGYTELIEGHLLMSPSPTPSHNIAIGELAFQLRDQLPSVCRTIADIDVDLELAPAGEPGFSRRPDLIIVERTVPKRVQREGGMTRAAEVLVIVEVMSPGTRRIDNRHKREEYAEAGIPFYWIIDLDEPASLVECQLTDRHGYRDQQRATGTFTTADPFPVKIDLNRLS